MNRTLNGVVMVAAMLIAINAFSACDEGAEAPAPGRYSGDHLRFTVSEGRLHTVSFVDIGCTIPFPDNPLLSICKRSAVAPSDEEIVIPSGGGTPFSGTIGPVALTGQFDGAHAIGTWTYTTTHCPKDAPCVGSGTWRAERFEALPEVEPADIIEGSDGDIGGVDDGGPILGTDTFTAPDVPAEASPLQVEAAGILAQIRAAVGVPQATQVMPINRAAKAHADYYATHISAYNQGQIGAHSENSNWSEGFTGASLGDRLAYQGVALTAAGEVMAFTGTPQGAFDGWMATLYHRTPLVHPDTATYGFGSSTVVNVEVVDVVYGPATSLGPALWPIEGATGVSVGWNGYESPQPPLPAGESYPSGPIITATWGHGVALALTEATLSEPNGTEVPSQVQTPKNDSHLRSTWSIYALSPLKANTTYTVRLKGAIGGQGSEVSWSFTTGS